MSDDPHLMSVVDVRREVENLKGLMEQRICALKEVITTRLDAMDKALELSTTQSAPVIGMIQKRFDDRLAFYELDRAEILRRLAELERIAGEKK